ncbi:hypothetical protein MJO28_014182 [Puccinia striiformis f. sp. tritici]|uniref:Uncharacterized protein n=4 Tax=Puccinia striiformis TaxID=27350 RepID=A0A0L0W4S1_9BASI|nr:hypothetical protein Pst134EA_026650 [Puccinia striiformis f. sp. tritici]KAI9626228.1 hypothetical protein KEM48_010478 [Puccinia striiformis f. sp. tritici PST-130]KNF06300.1 hypothetical protein PSTG_00806 [Puccinia striiformis f. sp. tritici PST-78]POW05871.1 hypothetical protein PSTT_09417 [Puccinia striiformis]KAH9442857.1 hypothetical protein Pst134EB_027209 [Puccinia striiformis f. sp. tritici]KAH9449938.1 hypothetical protein Pst134EA_026650 [Puccinia striiformis f. sp. tritici]
MSSISSNATRKSGSSAAGSPTKRYDRSSPSAIDSGASPNDVNKPSVNLVRCLKAVWPGRRGSMKRASSRALEFQLQLQQERLRCEWHAMTDGGAGWRVNRVIDPYRPLDRGFSDQVHPAHTQTTKAPPSPSAAPLRSSRSSSTLQFTK